MLKAMFRRLLLGVAVGAVAIVVATPVEASDWCIRDPALVFSAPHAKHTKITIYATEGVQGQQHASALRKVHLDFKTKPGKGRGTINVTVHANVPRQGHERFATVLIVSSEPFGAGTIYGVAIGTSGHDMHVSFEFLYVSSG
jgi:hypothetical protein